MLSDGCRLLSVAETARVVEWDWRAGTVLRVLIDAVPGPLSDAPTTLNATPADNAAVAAADDDDAAADDDDDADDDEEQEEEEEGGASLLGVVTAAALDEASGTLAVGKADGTIQLLGLLLTRRAPPYAVALGEVRQVGYIMAA